jgi:SAM-dependent methyltransferase
MATNSSITTTFYSIPKYTYTHYGLLLAKIVRGISNSKYRLLDAGCGNDELSVNIDVMGAERIGIDISLANIRSSKRVSKAADYVLADLTKLPFKDNSFNGVICINVIEHIEDKALASSELARATKKGGFFVGCTTSLVSPVLWVDSKLPIIAKPLVSRFAGAHYERHGRFTPAGLTNTLSRSGYSVDYWIIGHPQFTHNLWLERLWVIFNRVTKKKPLLYLNEMLVWRGIRI